MLRTLTLLSAVLTVLLAGGVALFREEAQPVVAGPPPAPQCAPVAPGLVSWWRTFDYIPGLIAKDHGPANAAGTPTGDVTIDDGYIGDTLGFGGVNGQFTLGNPAALKLTSAITIEAWIKLTSLAENQYAPILTKWSEDNSLGANSNSYWFGLVGTPSGATVLAGVNQEAPNSALVRVGGTISPGQWTHVAMTYESATGAITLYINGGIVDIYVAPGYAMHTSNATMSIGAQTVGAQRFFNGKIDELSVYSKALTGPQIAAISTAGASGKCVLTVNSTGDASDANAGDGICRTATPGECTMRAAIQESNSLAGADFVPFGIDGCGGICVIAPASQLPAFTGQVKVDGYTQPGASPNSAAFGSPLNGTLLIQINVNGFGLVFNENGSTLRGLRLSGTFGGVLIYGNNTIQGNYITGIISVREANNRIGGTTAADRNLIYGSTTGIELVLADNNVVEGNYIGTATDPTVASPNIVGIGITGGSNNRVGGTGAGQQNLIAFNSGAGVFIRSYDSGTIVPATGNQIRGNSIHSNGTQGIDLTLNGNLELAAPVVKSTGPLGAGGTGCANCTIDVYSDTGSQGRTYQGTTTAAGDGKWFLNALMDGPNITATNTDAGNNTSEFSAPLAKGNDSDGDGYTDTAEFLMGESPVIYCAIMRANVDNSADNTVSILDLAAVAQQFGQNIPPANPRFNQLQGSDASINILDLAAMAGQFLQNVSACP